MFGVAAGGGGPWEQGSSSTVKRHSTVLWASRSLPQISFADGSQDVAAISSPVSRSVTCAM